MNGIFVLAPVIIGLAAVFVFGSVIMTFFSVFRHRGMMHKITDEVLRQAKSGAEKNEANENNTTVNAGPTEYSCSQCGASLGVNTEVSPSGDFKCQFCNSWSNVNR